MEWPGALIREKGCGRCSLTNWDLEEWAQGVHVGSLGGGQVFSPGPQSLWGSGSGHLALPTGFECILARVLSAMGWSPPGHSASPES